ncbi:MAG TPA: FKBP-type peptidyl-prolyl cis-trans isomerase [Gammaproteobacteria bacterium]|nr:FKBP-type peptidyl-prolyl cis-trans isomerase [Gammaproteobacteria bacterium]
MTRQESEVSDEVAIYHGSEVVMHFTITLEDGTVAETSVGEEPLRFVMGDSTLVEGMELALFGLKAGDKQSLRIGPETAYGFPDPENVQAMDRADFPEDMDLKPGLIVSFALPDGEEYPGMITEVGDNEVMVDFNHPLAGHEILFDVEILEVTGGEEPPTVQ